MQVLHFFLDKICKLLTYNTPAFLSLTTAKLSTFKKCTVFIGPPCIKKTANNLFIVV